MLNKKGYTNMLNIIQQLQNKLTVNNFCKVYIEDSDDYDTITVNIAELLKCLVVDEEYSVAGYTLYGGGLNTNTNGDKLGFMCNNIYADSSMLNVFLDEDEVKTFVQNYNNDDEE
jgi:hypothetical protein|tara:strand:- start:192 stop:536 length:345 start_codon:yes stop_codon:yes gene_type:complete